ncbi:transporter [Roseomonas sp. HF4]|uniref:transporter n=1 Tax=Roseomonas sp. HF4 TaxID=2562313 RepID=UPI0010C0DD11|nr:transporter [Roseomonas sp. HF4]
MRVRTGIVAAIASSAGLPRARRRIALAVGLVTGASAASAQDIEPRAFANTPVGVNFVIGGYAFTRGSLSSDPAVPLTDAQLQTSSLVLAYAHSFEILGMSAKLDAAAPFSWLSGTGNFAGQPVERTVSGLGDARFRLSVNFLGAPALTLEEFATWQQDLILGASVQVSVPVGQYDPTRAVNLGTNRWFLRPEIGASQRFGPLTLEATAAITFFSDNSDFLRGQRRSQEPLHSFQGHAIYSFGQGIWVSVDATYFTGGRTSIDGEANDDLLRNWRLGATFSFPLSAHYSVRLYGSRGVSARTGNNFDLLGAALQYRWGGGL